MGYSFKGSCVYVSVAARNAQYTISIDAQETIYGESSDSTTTPGNCTFGWMRTNLTATDTHYLEISVLGSAAGRRDTESWALELQNFVITQPDSSATGISGSTDSASTASAKAGSGSGSTNAASTNMTHSSLAILAFIFALYLHVIL